MIPGNIWLICVIGLLQMSILCAFDRVRNFSTQDELNKILEEEEEIATVVGYFDIYGDSESFEVFKLVSRGEVERANFAATTNKKLLAEMTKGPVAVVLHLPKKFVQPNLEQAVVPYSAKKLRADSLATFVRTKAVPLVGELTHISESLYEVQPLPVLTLFVPVDAGSPEHVRRYMQILTEVADHFKGKVVATIASAVNQKVQMSNFKISLKGRPDMVVGIRIDDMHYSEISHRDVTKDELLRFTGDVLDGKREGRYVDRSPAKKDVAYDGTAVVSLTHETFNDVVTYSGKHALVVFYAPWCGICKAMRPDLIQAAKLLQADERIVIAAMDTEAQGPPKGFKIDGFPSIFYLNPNGDEPEEYEYDRRAHSLVHFIKEKLDIAGHSDK